MFLLPVPALTCSIMNCDLVQDEINPFFPGLLLVRVFYTVVERKLEQQPISPGGGSCAVSPSPPVKALGEGCCMREHTFSHTVLGLSTPTKIHLLVPIQNRKEVMHTGH